jgi:dUTPase
MKIAQIVFERYEDVNFIQVESLEESERGGK